MFIRGKHGFAFAPWFLHTARTPGSPKRTPRFRRGRALTRKPMRLPRRNCTFRFAIALVMFTLLIAAIGAVATVSYYFGRRNVEMLAVNILQQTLGRVELRIQALTRQAVEQNHLHARLLAGGQFSAADFGRMEGFLAQALQVSSNLTYLGFGLESTGEYLMAERQTNAAIRVREYRLAAGGQRVIQDLHLVNGRLQPAVRTRWDGYDPRQRPYYQLARQAGREVWTDTYDFWAGHEGGAVPGITLATPSVDPQGRLLGVWNADFDLDSLNRFLNQVQQEVPAYLFIMELRRDGTRRVIAHSASRFLSTASGTAAAPAAEQRARQLLAGAVRKADWDRGPQRHEMTFAGETFMGDYRALVAPDQPRWVLGMLLPKSAMMATVQRNREWAILILLVCLAAASLAIVAISKTVSRPLVLATHEAGEIGRFNFDPKTPSPSRIREVARLLGAVEEMKTSLRSFQKYVPAELVRELLREGIEARLGGHKRTLTISFTDIAGFTGLAEKLPPEALVDHLGEYLGALSECVHAHRGTVDKYIGDALMAFWGAPETNPNHALDACLAALEQQRVLGGLQQRWRRAGKPEFTTRTGIHTGEVIVGNIGSETRLNYTVIGDPVNLASRLESLGKIYRARILITEDTWTQVRDRISARPVDRVQVKGKAAGKRIFELLGTRETEAAGTRQTIELTNRALGLYFAGDFAAARELYEELRRHSPNDGVAAVMSERCRNYLLSPPGPDWNGVHVFHEK